MQTLGYIYCHITKISGQPRIQCYRQNHQQQADQCTGYHSGQLGQE